LSLFLLNTRYAYVKGKYRNVKKKGWWLHSDRTKGWIDYRRGKFIKEKRAWHDCDSDYNWS